MTPKMNGVLDSLKQLKSYVDDEANKLTRRIHDTTMPAVQKGFATAHGTVDAVHGVVKDIEDFANELSQHNGGEALGNSDSQSPRSSEVAQK